MKKKIIFAILFLIFIFSAACGFLLNNKMMQKNQINISIKTYISKFKVKIEEKKKDSDESKMAQDIEIVLKDVDGKQTTYSFEYNNKTYTAIFSNGCWKIIDSYKIKNTNAMNAICKALIEVHPILGKDRKSYRTVGDLVYEWVQHNLAYSILSDESEFKLRAKDVDLDPDDQGKNFMELYEDRTGKKFNLNI
jgi:hypothetical protein